MAELVIDTFLGMNNVDSEIGLDPKLLTKADNVVLTNLNKVKKSSGLNILNDSPDNCHSLYSFGNFALFRSGSSIYKLNQDGSIELLYAASELNTQLPMRYLRIVDTIYMMDGNAGFVYDVSDNRIFRFGISVPNKPSVERQSGGRIRQGTYKIKVSNIRVDGRESGLSDYAQISLQNNDKLIVRLEQHAPDDVAWRNVYITEPDGSVFKYVGTFDVDSDIIEFFDITYYTLELLNKSSIPMPTGKSLAVFNSRLWVSVSNTLWFSDVFSYEATLPDNFIQLQDFILDIHANSTSLLVNCIDGVYCIYQDMHIRKVYTTPLLEGSITPIDLGKLTFFEQPMSGVALMGVSKSGIIVFLPDGSSLSLTEGRFNFEPYNKATTAILDGHNFKFNLK